MPNFVGCFSLPKISADCLKSKGKFWFCKHNRISENNNLTVSSETKLASKVQNCQLLPVTGGYFEP